MSDRPWSLDHLRQNFMYQIAAKPEDRREQAAAALKNSDQFRETAHFAIDNDLNGSAVSNLHESARLAITAKAAADGFRFNSDKGGHAPRTTMRWRRNSSTARSGLSSTRSANSGTATTTRPTSRPRPRKPRSSNSPNWWTRSGTRCSARSARSRRSSLRHRSRLDRSDL